jgi:hypothetical protein
MSNSDPADRSRQSIEVAPGSPACVREHRSGSPLPTAVVWA